MNKLIDWSVCAVCNMYLYVNSGGAGENMTANTTRYQCCSGLCIDLLNMLSEKIGLELDLFEVPDRKFGSYDRAAATVCSMQTQRLSNHNYDNNVVPLIG